MTTENDRSGAGDASFGSDLELMKRMRWCCHILHHRYNLNFSRNKVLLLLFRQGPMTQKALMDELRIQAGSLSEMLSKMEQQELIEKTRCPQDKRNCRLALTDAGREQARAFEQKRLDMAAFLFQPLNDEDKRTLGRILDVLTEHWCTGPEEKGEDDGQQGEQT